MINITDSTAKQQEKTWNALFLDSFLFFLILHIRKLYKYVNTIYTYIKIIYYNIYIYVYWRYCHITQHLPQNHVLESLQSVQLGASCLAFWDWNLTFTPRNWCHAVDNLTSRVHIPPSTKRKIIRDPATFKGEYVMLVSCRVKNFWGGNFNSPTCPSKPPNPQTRAPAKLALRHIVPLWIDITPLCSLGAPGRGRGWWLIPNQRKPKDKDISPHMAVS